MITIHAAPGTVIKLGRQGENLARQVEFDISLWRALFGEGTVELLAKRQGDSTPYPCVTYSDGDCVFWPVTTADVAKPGPMGFCELTYLVGDQIVRSEKWRTVVLDSLGVVGPPPDSAKGWVDQVLQAAQRAESAAARAESAGGSGSAGTTDHTLLINRDAPEQHPIAAISGLQTELQGKMGAESALTNIEIYQITGE